MKLKTKRIRWVDGFRVRNSYPDFDLVASDGMSGVYRDGHTHPYIPEGEVWVDRRFRREKSFLFKVHEFEYAKRDWKYAKTRAELKKRLCRKGTPPNFVVRRRQYRGVTILYVRGDIVRQWIDPAFIFGGHDLVYRYIPEGEVWIDIRQDPREIPFTLAHELCERELMSRGWYYRDAHQRATEVELKLRQQPKKSRAESPLRIKLFAQSAGYCGPASLKMAAEHFGRVYKEKEIEKLCRKHNRRRTPTSEYGTDHDELVGAAEALGATVETKENGTLADIRRNLRKGRPVIVGWWSTFESEPDDPPGADCGHFSVIYQVTDAHVRMADPENGACRRKLTHDGFLRRWHDTDEDSVLVSVQNTGPQIAPATAANLFGKYQRGSGGKRGMGLYFCRLVAEAHGGRIECESRADGPCFVMRLPGRA